MDNHTNLVRIIILKKTNVHIVVKGKVLHVYMMFTGVHELKYTT